MDQEQIDDTSYRQQQELEEEQERAIWDRLDQQISIDERMELHKQLMLTEGYRKCLTAK